MEILATESDCAANRVEDRNTEAAIDAYGDFMSQT